MASHDPFDFQLSVRPRFHVAGHRWSSQDFDIHRRVLGEGRFGNFHYAHCRIYNRPCALKISDKKQELIKKGCTKKHLKREIEHLLLLQDHPNILRFWTGFLQADRLFMIHWVFNRGSLEKMLVDHGVMGELRTMSIFRQLVDVVDYCHSRRIMHRDICPGNVFFVAEDQVKLSNFDMSVLKKGHGPYLYTMCVTNERYRAPEMVLHIPYDEKVDVFSLGVVLYRMLAGQVPYFSVYNMDMYLRLEFDAHHLISKFRQKDPSKRIALCEVPNHGWFRRVLRNSVPDDGLIDPVETVE